MQIGAFYYPWYDTNLHWNEGYIGNPVLGEYSSRDPEIVEKHIACASQFGIDFFLASWWGPESWEDITLRDFIFTQNIPDHFSFGILYETLGRLPSSPDGQIDFDDPIVIQQLKNDLEYLAQHYFNQDAYLVLEGKPVVFLYLTRIFTGDVNSGIQEARDHLTGLGYELYLIGDQVYWQNPNSETERELMNAFDAVTAYNMHTSVNGIANNFVTKVMDKYEEWQAVATQENVDFIPKVMPGFDDTAVRPQANHPVIPRTVTDFGDYCQEALNFLPDNNLILINSWNEWHEYTQVEPDKDYGYEYLEVIEQKLAKYK